MDLEHVAMCHCSIHKEVFLYEKGKRPVSFRTPEMRDKIIYVSRSCPSPDPNTLPDMTSVEPNTKDYIWTIACPIYGIMKGIEFGKINVFDHLITQWWDALKIGGKVMIPLLLEDNKHLDRFRELLKEKSEEIKKPWDFQYIERYDSLPIIVTAADFGRGKEWGGIILTKISGGGKRRNRRYTKKNRLTRKKRKF